MNNDYIILIGFYKFPARKQTRETRDIVNVARANAYTKIRKQYNIISYNLMS